MRRSAAASSPGAAVAMPTLALMTTAWSDSANGSRSASTTDAAIRGATSPFRSSTRTANSSPPSRAAMPSAPTHRLSRCANWTSRASPASCPRLSFTTLKRSKSMKSSANVLHPLAKRLGHALRQKHAVAQARERVSKRLARVDPRDRLQQRSGANRRRAIGTEDQDVVDATLAASPRAWPDMPDRETWRRPASASATSRWRSRPSGSHGASGQIRERLTCGTRIRCGRAAPGRRR